MTDQIQLIFAALAAVVWLVRLEGKILAQDRANMETQKDVDVLRVDHNKISEDLAKIRESLARIEGGLLSSRNREGE